MIMVTITNKDYDNDNTTQNKNLPVVQEYPSLLFYFHLNWGVSILGLCGEDSVLLKYDCHLTPTATIKSKQCNNMQAKLWQKFEYAIWDQML